MRSYQRDGFLPDRRAHASNRAGRRDRHAKPPPLSDQRRLRDERRFDSPELLREQIGKDVRTAQRFFRKLSGFSHA